MHGVPPDLPLERFVGQELNQIALGRFQVQLHFAGCGSIFVEGRWELRDADGGLIDQEQEHVGRDCWRLHRVLDLPVLRFEIDPPRSFSLIFEQDYRITVFDDTPQYEAFSLHLDGMPSMYV